MLTCKNLQSGFEIPQVEKYGRFGGAAMEQGRNLIPFGDMFYPHESKAFGRPTIEERLGLSALGPTFYPRPTDYGVLRQQGGTGDAKPKKRKRKVRRQL
jgi:hypothetical protein